MAISFISFRKKIIIFQKQITHLASIQTIVSNQGNILKEKCSMPFNFHEKIPKYQAQHFYCYNTCFPMVFFLLLLLVLLQTLSGCNITGNIIDVICNLSWSFCEAKEHLNYDVYTICFILKCI